MVFTLMLFIVLAHVGLNIFIPITLAKVIVSLFVFPYGISLMIIYNENLENAFSPKV